MRKALTIAGVCLGIAALGAPAGQAAKGERAKSATAKECVKLQQADRAAFKATYGDRAMRACIRGNPVATDETSPREFKRAAQECRAERRDDAALFEETYGSNRNKRNALGKCVSGKVRADKV